MATIMWESQVEAAKAKAKKEGKPILLDLSASPK